MADADPAAADGSVPTVIASPRIVSMLWLFLLILLAFHFALSLQQIGRPYLDADAYTHFHEKRPYQYRTLMAPLMGGLMQLFSWPLSKALLLRLPAYLWTPESAAYLSINAASFAASCWLMFAIASKVLGPGVHARLALAIYIVLTYLFFCLNPNVAFILPYDVPSLALSQACLLCVLERRWGRLYLLFAFATVNRETSFLVIVFVAVGGLMRPPLRRVVVPVVVMCGIWIAIKLGLYLALSNLPTDEGLRLGYNVRSLLKPWQWPALLPLVACFATALWSLKSRVGQPEWAVTACIGFALIFVVGQITETRAFADLLVFFTLAIAQWLSPGSASSSDRTRRPDPGHRHGVTCPTAADDRADRESA